MNSYIKIALTLFITGVMGVISIIEGVLFTIFLEAIMASLTPYTLEYILSFPACEITQYIVMALMVVYLAYVNWTFVSKPLGRRILEA